MGLTAVLVTGSEETNDQRRFPQPLLMTYTIASVSGRAWIPDVLKAQDQNKIKKTMIRMTVMMTMVMIKEINA